jgi:dTMP kinase
MPLLSSKFIVLDGGEGCGKTTQIHLLRSALESRGIKVIAARDPGATRVGEQVRAILLNPDTADLNMRCEMLLYMAARAQLMAETILPALNAGHCVICDRFVSSTLAYQLGGDGLTAGEITAVADIAINRRWPDLTIILDMPLEQSQKRLNRPKDRIEQRSLEYHERVRQNFLGQAAGDPLHYRIVRSDRDLSVVHADVLASILELESK